MVPVTLKSTPLPDSVEHPKHYTHGEIECIDAIESALGREGFQSFLQGQVIKYAWRMNHKGNAPQDAAKLSWYAKRLLEATEGNSTQDNK